MYIPYTVIPLDIVAHTTEIVSQWLFLCQLTSHGHSQISLASNLNLQLWPSPYNPLQLTEGKQNMLHVTTRLGMPHFAPLDSRSWRESQTKSIGKQKKNWLHLASSRPESPRLDLTEFVTASKLRFSFGSLVEQRLPGGCKGGKT